MTAIIEGCTSKGSPQRITIRDRPIMLIFLPIMLCCSAQILTYYAQYYAHVKDLCLKI